LKIMYLGDMNAESSEKSTGATQAPPVEPEKPLGSRAPQAVQRSRPLHLTWQIVIFIVGLAIVAGGIVLLPLPGPGWLVIFAGIGVWATEFPWAQRVLRWAKQKVQQSARYVKAKRQIKPGGPEAGGGQATDRSADQAADRSEEPGGGRGVRDGGGGEEGHGGGQGGRAA
jgi:uncharacterized protein (TIGR02611 family)